MRLFPPSTNDAYSGSLLSAPFLTLFSVLTIVPGCIHVFAPDGGAGTIEGLSTLSQNGLGHRRAIRLGGLQRRSPSGSPD